jgi:hypothetical protein
MRVTRPPGLHQPLDPSRRQKLWDQHHRPAAPLHSLARRAALEGVISINLGVKRILIEDSMEELLLGPQGLRAGAGVQAGRREEEGRGGSGAALVLSGILVLLFLFLTFGLSVTSNKRRYAVRKV